MFKYDVTLSFAGEERSYVEDIAKLLKEQNIKVFYDNFETSNLWGKDLYQYFQSIYKEQALYCVIFFSKNYLKKFWTRHELKQAQARAFFENREYILPVIIDVNLNDIPGMNATTGFIEYKDFSHKKIVELIIEKINNSYNEQQNNFLKIKFKKNTFQLLFDDILFIESVSPLIYVHAKEDKYKMYSKLSSILPILPNNFIRIHHSIIVNQNEIKSISSREVILTNNAILPVSRPYRQIVSHILGH